MKSHEVWKKARWLFTLGSLLCANAAALEVSRLRCEYLENPQGVEVTAPRLSWQLRSAQRGDCQKAYRVLVASTASNLHADRGDLWDSGRVDSDQSIQVAYRGRPLTSRLRVYWKVWVWGADERVSAWSKPAQWSMGLLEPGDWKASWIADPESMKQAKEINSRGPHNGYHSEFSTSPDSPKWVAVDLGRPQEIDGFRLHPARPFDWQPDTPGFLFPVRFKIELAQSPDFSDVATAVDFTAEDQPNPGTNAPLFRISPRTGRYVRLVATRLGLRSGTDYGLALAELEVLHEGRNLAQGAPVTALDSIESGAWSKSNLVDGRTLPELANAPLAARPGVLFRKTFEVGDAIRSARVYVSGLGLYELRINGVRVGDHLLAPEWTDYRKRIQYQTYDVTRLLRRGRNAIASMVGEGWYMGRLMGMPGNAYGNSQRFLLQLEMELANGQIQTVVTDRSWRSTIDGPIRASGIYDGESYDARREIPEWDKPGGDESIWHAVRVLEAEPARLVAQPNEPIRIFRSLQPISLSQPKRGVYVFDFGQNVVGWCRLKARGPTGATITLRHAEMVNEDGTIYTANLRGAPQIDRYTLRGVGSETFEPHFTYHGFRYVEVTGMPQRPELQALTARVFHSAAPEAGEFECSSPALNQLLRNIVWTERANLMSAPTDCPQRDERFGWMGDIQAFLQTAIYNLQLPAFFTKWVRDIRDSQADDGRFPDFAPHPGNPNTANSGAPAWADAGVLVPWRAYLNYADTRLLEEHFDSACRWIDYVLRLNPDLIWAKGRNNDYNDWLNGDWIRQKDWPAKGGSVPNEVFATAFFAHSSETVARIAQVLGRNEEARRYGELARHIKAAFNRKFVEPDGRIAGDTQGGYALALNFDLLPEELRARAADRLAEGIRHYQGHLSTGIQTTHRAMLELTRYGHHDIAWQVLTNRTFPSWFYMIDNGATTIWERWDGYVKGRGFQDPGMNSFNHWALGAVGEWIWRHFAGINPDESHPGFKHFIIRPRPCPGLTWSKASYQSMYGQIRCEWKIEKGIIRLQVEVPPNSAAAVYVPCRRGAAVTENRKIITRAPGVAFQGTSEDGAAIFEVKAGSYSFSAPAPF